MKEIIKNMSFNYFSFRFLRYAINHSIPNVAAAIAANNNNIGTANMIGETASNKPIEFIMLFRINNALLSSRVEFLSVYRVL